MRIAIVSDIHGNRTAFEAVLSDLKKTSPDLVLHGGDLADSGASPVEIIDHLRDLGWEGVLGNTDEMLFRPESLKEFALGAVIEEMAAAAREALGEERLAWLAALPRMQRQAPMALVHATLESVWRAPEPEASDADLESAYGVLGQDICVYAHIHKPYIRRLSDRIVANTGSVSLSFDGDKRASYLLIDEGRPSIRRVEYDLDRELKALATCGIPHADWIASILETASPQMPR